jgi:hypothetical protein
MTIFLNSTENQKLLNIGYGHSMCSFKVHTTLDNQFIDLIDNHNLSQAIN